MVGRQLGAHNEQRGSTNGHAQRMGPHAGDVNHDLQRRNGFKDVQGRTTFCVEQGGAGHVAIKFSEQPLGIFCEISRILIKRGNHGFLIIRRAGMAKANSHIRGFII